MRVKLTHTATHRTCYRCRQLKLNAAFTWRSNGKPFSACKECNKAMARERRERLAPRCVFCGATRRDHDLHPTHAFTPARGGQS